MPAFMSDFVSLNPTYNLTGIVGGVERSETQHALAFLWVWVIGPKNIAIGLQAASDNMMSEKPD